jgi:hypothetical protein
MSTNVDYQFLEARPKSAYRQLFVKGTRIRADVIYRACTALAEFLATDDDEPRTPEQVALDYGLPVQAVWEAVAYCRSQPAEIAVDDAREERLMNASGENQPGYKNDPKGHYRVLSPQEWAELSQDEALPG